MSQTKMTQLIRLVPRSALEVCITAFVTDRRVRAPGKPPSTRRATRQTTPSCLRQTAHSMRQAILGVLSRIRRANASPGQ